MTMADSLRTGVDYEAMIREGILGKHIIDLIARAEKAEAERDAALERENGLTAANRELARQLAVEKVRNTSLAEANAGLSSALAAARSRTTYLTQNAAVLRARFCDERICEMTDITDEVLAGDCSVDGRER